MVAFFVPGIFVFYCCLNLCIMSKKWILTFLLFYAFNVSGQYFNAGQDRASLKWAKISTSNFEVIFPEGFEFQARRVVALLEKSYEVTSKSLQHHPKKISVVLHTETVKSNAFLGWAPSRIEMYTTPHQGTYAQDWLEQLAIHEYRHMVQVSKIESEMPKLLRFLFGEQAAALLTAMYLPFWLIEGDAVAAETGLSTSGRGRQPDFHRELRAQLIEKGLFSYDKAYLGSYRDNVPNHYEMGYFLAGGSRAMFGKTIWDEVLNHVARHPFSLNAFNRGLKKSIGLNKIQLYDTVFQTLKAEWINLDEQILPSEHYLLSPNSNNYTNYRYIYPLSDSTFFAEKNSMSDVNRFVMIDQKGREQHVFTPGYHFDESVTVRNSIVAWIERMPHIRWHHADYSLLRIYDLEEKILHEYKLKTKLFAPAFSPDMKQIAVVEADEKFQFFLTIIDVETGQILKRIPSPANSFLITPSWMSNGNEVLVVALHNNQKGIIKINIEKQQSEEVFPFDSYEIKRPFEQDNYIYFIAGFEGIDNIYRITQNGECEKVVQARFGVADHALRTNYLYYSNYTANGFQLVRSPLNALEISPFSLDTLKTVFPIAEVLTEQEGGPVVFDNLQADSLQITPYKKWQNLFKVHSWAPLAIIPSAYSAYPGASILSQNILSTSEFSGGYRYRWQDRQGEFYLNYAYMGLFPVFEIEANTGSRNSYYYQIMQYLDEHQQLVRSDTIRKDFKWQESNLMFRASLPLNLSKGKHYRRLQPRVRYQFSHIVSDGRAHDQFPEGIYQRLETGLYYHHLLQAAAQDVQPNYGFILDMSYQIALTGPVDFGKLIAFSNLIYLPGLHKNHGISLYNGYQNKSTSEYTYSDRIRFPRGHQHIINNEMYSAGIDYELPLCYPDVQLLGLVYLKRLRMKVYYDQAWYKGINVINQINYPYQGSIRSTGIELAFDSHLMRFIAPIEFGIRGSYLFNKQFKADLLFNITFSI